MILLHWCTISTWHGHSVTDIAERLRLLGVQLRDPGGTVYYFVDDESDGEVMKSVGTLTVEADGTIGVSPHRGIPTEPDLRALLGAAEEAFRAAPSRATGWRYRRSGEGGPWWSAEILIPVDPREDRVANLVVRQSERLDNQRTLDSPHRGF